MLPISPFLPGSTRRSQPLRETSSPGLYIRRSSVTYHAVDVDLPWRTQPPSAPQPPLLVTNERSPARRAISARAPFCCDGDSASVAVPSAAVVAAIPNGRISSATPPAGLPPARTLTTR